MTAGVVKSTYIATADERIGRDPRAVFRLADRTETWLPLSVMASLTAGGPVPSSEE